MMRPVWFCLLTQVFAGPVILSTRDAEPKAYWSIDSNCNANIDGKTVTKTDFSRAAIAEAVNLARNAAKYPLYGGDAAKLYFGIYNAETSRYTPEIVSNLANIATISEGSKLFKPFVVSPTSI